MSAKPCTFCRVIGRELDAHAVYENEDVLGFLDHRPLAHGHVLVVPKRHVATLHELPDELLSPLMAAVRLLSRAVETALDADGSFVAVNVKVSQSVPHLHVHVVPRKKKDGLFSTRMLWIRKPYPAGRAEEIAARVREAVAALSEDGSR